MLSKRELKEAYEEALRDHAIRRESDQKKFSDSYLEKALHNLELAGVLDMLSRNSEIKKSVGTAVTTQYFDWIIITSYYAMYLASTAALAKLGLKSETHKSTVIALEYLYCVHKNLIDRKYIEMIENANFGREDVQKLDNAMKGRVSVQYTITNRFGDAEAKRILKDAREFVNKISEIIR